MRDNETTRVAAVLAFAREGNPKAAVDALMQLWVEVPERDGIDVAAIDAWQAIVEIGAVDAAVNGGLALVRANRKIRRHAYIDLTEHASDDVLVELVDQVIAARWPVEPYLAAVFQRFAERNRADPVMAALRRHEQYFSADDAAWQLALYVMATSRIGTNHTLAWWFQGWQRRPRLAMWAVAAFTGTWFTGPSPADISGPHLKQLIAIAREALERLPWDDTAAWFLCLAMVGDLQAGEWDRFETTRRERHELLVQSQKALPLDHPIVRFANSLKHRHTVSEHQLVAPRAPLPDEADPKARLINRQLAEVIADLARAQSAVLEALDMFLKLRHMERGDPRVLDLMHQMYKLDQTGAGGWIRSAWVKLVKQRASWHQRLRYSMLPR